jgi:hypothetical protein
MPKRDGKLNSEGVTLDHQNPGDVCVLGLLVFQKNIAGLYFFLMLILFN